MTESTTVDLQVEKYTTADGVLVEAALISTADDVRALRDSEWADGQVRTLSFKTADPIAFVALEPPFEMGQQLRLPGFVVKHPAGDLAVVSPLEFSMKYSKVEAA